MKKLFTLLLTLVFVLSMGTAVFASEVDPTITPTPLVDPTSLVDVTTVNLTKNYDFPLSPTTTFNYVIAAEAVSGLETGSTLTTTNMPMLTFAGAVDSLTFAAADPYVGQKTLTLNLPVYTEIGYYTYRITETPTTTPWVTYETDPMFVKVTVLRNVDGSFKRIVAVRFGAVDAEPKGGTFDNSYNSGTLEVSKEVTGNFGDQDMEFEVTVTFSSPEGFPVAGSKISYTLPGETNPTALAWADGEAKITIPLKHLESVIFTNIPFGVTYEVTEADYTTDPDAYDAAEIVFSDSTKIIDATESPDTVDITNNKDIEVDTGISLDSLPYILLLLAAAAGMGVLLMKKRKNTDF